MRLATYRTRNGWRAGVALEGRLVDLRDALGASAPPTVREAIEESLDTADVLARCRHVLAEAPPLSAVTLGPPVPNPSKILCIGLNYRSHADEADIVVPDVPTVFAKFPNALIGHDAPITELPLSQQLDFEGELAVVIGRRGRDIAEHEALAHVAGCTALNDVSARDLQFQTSQWTIGKISDGFAPCGPWLVTLDELRDVQSLQLQTRVNGEVMQSASTSEMVFGVAKLISFLSSVVTLEPGDLIATGTPAGVGAARTPPVFLAPGDRVEIEIEGIGTLGNTVVGQAGRPDEEGR